MTIKVILKKADKKGLCPVVVKVQSGQQRREFPVGWKVKVDQFENGVVKGHPDKALINGKIGEKVTMITKYQTDCVMGNKDPNLKEIDNLKAGSFISYLKARKEHYIKSDKPAAGRRIGYAASELEELFGDLAFKNINADILRQYHTSISKKIKVNTVHKRFSDMRQLFTNAVDEGIYIGPNPFKSFKVKKVPVKKEKLTVEEIAEMEKLSLKGPVALARDIFLFSYYCKGIRFENCVFLQWKDIRDRIYIKTNKGQKFISVQIHEKLRVILDRYTGKGFVFGLVDRLPESQVEKEKIINPLNVVVNRDLKVVAAAAGIDKVVSMHISRHSIAFHLKQQGVNVGAIKDILGHSDTATTEKYLKSLDDLALDKEMDKVYK